MLQPPCSVFHSTILEHRHCFQQSSSSFLTIYSYLCSFTLVSFSASVLCFSWFSHMKHFSFPLYFFLFCSLSLSLSFFYKLRSYILQVLQVKEFFCEEFDLFVHLYVLSAWEGARSCMVCPVVCVRRGQWPMILWQTRCACASTNPYITVWPYLTNHTPAFWGNSKSMHTGDLIILYHQQQIGIVFAVLEVFDFYLKTLSTAHFHIEGCLV